MLKYISIFGLALLCTSCIQITGLTSDYKKLDPVFYPYLDTYETGKNLRPNVFHTITGEQIRQNMEHEEKVLVYLFTNGCSGPTCYPLATFKRWTEEQGYTLYLVAIGYNNLGITLEETVNIPLYVINNKAYDSNMRGKYRKRFLLDLLQNEPNANEIIKGNYPELFAFEKGKLTQTSHDLLQLEPKYTLTNE